MNSVVLNPTDDLRGMSSLALTTVTWRVVWIWLLGAGCSWPVDLDNLATRSHSPDASSGPDAVRDAASAEGMISGTSRAAADAIGGAAEVSQDEPNRIEMDARDSIAVSESDPDAREEDLLVQSDRATGTAEDTKPDDREDDGRSSDSGAADARSVQDDLAVEVAPASPAPTCPASPTANATLMVSSALSVVTGCGYAGSTVPAIHAAVDPKTFASSAACGVCILIETAAATVEAMVTDLGPEAQGGNPTAIAISKAGMELLAPDGATYVTEGVRWQPTACPVANSGMSFTFASGSNAYYASVLVQNHRYGLAKIEYKTGTTYLPLLRTSYNYWIAPLGMGRGPFSLRMTDAWGHTVEQSGIPLAPAETFHGESQFPLCSAK